MVLNQAGRLLFCLYINNISADIESEMGLLLMTVFEIKYIEDTVKIQKDIDHLGSWARKWRMRIQPVKCNMMQQTKKANS